MRLEIGNKVAVLDDVIKGIVVAINGNSISIKADGMTYVYQTNELVKIGVEQHELTKFSDINNSLLKEKNLPKKVKKSAFKTTKNEMVMEVDLHIHQLTKSSRGMDNYDMLSLQLETARRKLEFCIQKRIQRIVFIHGVGEGVLKSELQYLFNKYPVKYYDASYKKYGLGATEVYVFQNTK